VCGIWGGFNGETYRNMVLAILNIERGRDSFGFTTENEKGDGYDIGHGLGSIVQAMKDEGFPMDVYSKKMFLGHTRNSSVGTVTLKNAHPFTSGHITGAHNGRVANFWILKNEYKDQHKEVDAFDVDSEIIFWLLNEFGVNALARLEGRIACWWVDDRKPGKVFAWIWNQDFAVALKPYPAFSSDDNHLRVAGFDDIKKLEDTGQLIKFDMKEADKGFTQVAFIPGHTAPIVTVKDNRISWPSDTGFIQYPNTKKSLNDKEMTCIGRVWDVASQDWIKPKAFLNAVNDDGVTDSDEKHRVILSSIHIGASVYQCASCHEMVTKKHTTQNAACQDIHSGCGGVCEQPIAGVMYDLRQVASSEIAKFVGKVETRFHPREIRAFIKNDRTILTQKESKQTEATAGKQLHLPIGAEIRSICDICLGCQLKTPDLVLASCATFRHVDGASMCKMCISDCQLIGKGHSIVGCRTFRARITQERPQLKELLGTTVDGWENPCDKCAIEYCYKRGKVLDCSEATPF